MLYILRLITALLILSIISACGGGGGGGGGGGSSGGGGGNPAGIQQFNGTISPAWVVSDAAANVYRTAEYDNQWGLEAIHAAEAYAALNQNGKTVAGDNIKVAIVDTGVVTNHPDIQANLDVADSYNYFNDNNNISDQNGHGSNVSSIAAGVKNNIGTQGVAFDATIVASNTYCCDVGGHAALGNTDLAIADSAVISGVRVINASFGGNNATVTQDTIDAVTIAKNHDVLFVAAAGNAGANTPYQPAAIATNASLAGYVLAVAAVGDDSVIANFSNQCGDAKEYCLVSPGVGITGATYNAADPTHFYVADYSGTSQAAPHVTGAAAVLFGAWPFLTAPQVSTILLSTATDLGAAGTDVVYGHGMLNLYKAVQAEGSNGFAYGASVTDKSYDVRSSSFAVDPIFGDALVHNLAPALANAVFFDDYGRDYQANLAQKISTKSNYSFSGSLSNIMLNSYKNNVVPLAFGNEQASLSKLKLQVRSYTNDMAAKFSNLDKSSADRALSASNGFSFAQNLGEKNRVAFAFNVDELTNVYAEKFNSGNFISTNSIAANPYQYFVSGSLQNLQNTQSIAQSTQRNFNQLFVEQKLFGEKLRMNFSYQTSYQAASMLAKSSARDNQISDVNVSYTPNKETIFAFSLGNLREFNNNFLNSQSQGLFGTGGDSKTSYFKISASKNIFNNLNLITSFSEGVTQVNGNNLGLFRDYQNIRTRSAAIGMVADNILGGKVGFLYNEPMRVYSGKAQINVPIARDNAGNVTYYQGLISLVPQGRQQNYEMSYSRILTRESQIGLNFVITKDLGNIKGNDARLGLVNYRLRF